MLKNGFSMELAKLLTSTTYMGNLQFDLEQDTVRIEQNVIAQMQENDENEILIFEARNSL